MTDSLDTQPRFTELERCELTEYGDVVTFWEGGWITLEVAKALRDDLIRFIDLAQDHGLSSTSNTFPGAVDISGDPGFKHFQD